MRYLILILTLTYSIAGTAQTDERMHEVNVTASEFAINGSTNVNKFSCKLENYALSDTLKVRRKWANHRITFQNLTLSYPVEEFDCGLEAMNSDMQTLLNSEEYPQMTLKISNIQLKDNQKAIEQVFVNALVKLTIAGVSKDVLIEDGTVINHSESSLTFSGSVALNMRDFGMEPPVRMWGLVEVNEMLTVSFAVSMNVKNL